MNRMFWNSGRNSFMVQYIQSSNSLQLYIYIYIYHVYLHIYDHSYFDFDFVYIYIYIYIYSIYILYIYYKMMKMMMYCFCGMVDRRKAFSPISSRDHCQISSPSRISDMPRAGHAESEFRLS